MAGSPSRVTGARGAVMEQMGRTDPNIVVSLAPVDSSRIFPRALMLTSVRTRPLSSSERARGIVNAWEDWRVEVDEHCELDDECVRVLRRNAGRGQRSDQSSSVSDVSNHDVSSAPRSATTCSSSDWSDPSRA